MKTFMILLLAVLLSGCAWTSIIKADGTEIRHKSFLVNTKNVEITDGKTGIVIGTQTISLEELQNAIAFLRASKVGTP